MFAKETYVQRRAQLKKTVGSGVLLFLGNEEQGLNYEDNTFRYRQDSTFLYYFGLSFAGLSAIEDREIIFGDELSIDYIVWMGTQPTLREKAGAVGIADTRPSADITTYLHKAVQRGQNIHYLPPYRAEHKLKLMDRLGLPPAHQEGSVPFIRAVVAQRNYKTAEEIEEIEKACNVTADMHIAATRFIRPGMYEYEVVAEMNRVAESTTTMVTRSSRATSSSSTPVPSCLRVTAATCRLLSLPTRRSRPASVPFTRYRTPCIWRASRPCDPASPTWTFMTFRPASWWKA